MTQFLNKSFTVNMTPGKSYRDNWERVFAKDKEKAPPEEPVEPELAEPVICCCAEHFSVGIGCSCCPVHLGGRSDVG